MGYKIIILSYLYKEYLSDFYRKNPVVKELPFFDHYNLLLNDSSETVTSYTRTLNELGIESKGIISNDNLLSNKWLYENRPTGKSVFDPVSEQIKDVRPDILWIDNIKYLNKDWLDQIRDTVPSIKKIIASQNAPYNTNIISGLREVDMLFTCTPGLHDFFVNQGINTYLLYHGFDKSFLKRIESFKAPSEHNFIFSGSLFLGSGYHNERIGFIEEILDSDLKLDIFGNIEPFRRIFAKKSFYYLFQILKKLKLDNYVDLSSFFKKYENYKEYRFKGYSKKLKKSIVPPVFGLEMFKLLQNSRIVLNTHGEIAGNWAGNMRLFEATGVGTCLITDNKRNMVDLFTPDHEVVLYDRVEECIEKVKWLLDHEKERKAISESGQIRTLRDHTVEERCKQIIEIISKELG